MRRAVQTRACAALLGLLLAACGLELDESGGAPRIPEDGPDAGQGGERDVGTPPEQEDRFVLQAPRASRSYVFVANTTLNSVARIDSLTLEVTAIEVCLEPTVVQTLPTYDRAVVLCEGDDRVAVIDAGHGDDEVRFTWVAGSSNRLLLAPNGDFALAWYDERSARPLDRPGNPNDLTLVALGAGPGDDGDEPRSYLLSVGFGVRGLQFDAAGDTVFVTTEDGLNVIEMATIDADQFVPLLSLGEDPLARADDREVHVTDDGALAFVRSSTFAGLRVLDIATGELSDIPLPAVPTDLDLFPGGARGVAVLRDIESVAVLPLPGAVGNPELVELLELPGRTIGLAQIAPQSQAVLLYTTVLGSSVLTVLDVESGTFRSVDLRKGIVAVVMAPEVDRALIVHSRSGGAPVAGEPLDDFIAKSSGYSLFDVATGFARLALTETDPDALVFTERGDQAFVLLDDVASDVRAVQWVDFGTFRVRNFEMAKPPESVGVVPATGRIYVSQRAATGRITFIDTATGRQEHVTAYQLNRRIE
jgi:DNA-binding beta-propeller fold protein YncE